MMSCKASLELEMDKMQRPFLTLSILTCLKETEFVSFSSRMAEIKCLIQFSQHMAIICRKYSTVSKLYRASVLQTSLYRFVCRKQQTSLMSASAHSAIAQHNSKTIAAVICPRLQHLPQLGLLWISPRDLYVLLQTIVTLLQCYSVGPAGRSRKVWVQRSVALGLQEKLLRSSG